MESKDLKDLREKRKQWFSQMESLLGPGPETKSQGAGLKNIVTIARYARNKGIA